MGPQKKIFEGNKAFPKGEYDYIFNIEHEGRNLKLPFNDG